MGVTELLLVIAVVAGIIAVLYPTLRGAAADAEREEPGRSAGDAEAGSSSDAEGRAHELAERREKILASLDEIAADHEAGNLSDRDYESLRARYEREAVEVLRELRTVRASATKARRPAPARAESSGTRWSSVLGWVAVVVAFVTLAGLALNSAIRPRGDDGVITGTVPSRSPPADTGGASGGALMPVDQARLAELERRVAADSSDVAALVEVGHLYLASQRFGEVARVSMKALDHDPDQPEALTHLGMVLIAADHAPEGRRAFDRALEIDPDFHEALLYKGIVSFQNREFEAAVEAWERYLEVAPPDANVERVRSMLQGARRAARADGS